MTSNDWEDLKTYILSRNEYFTIGFANAFKDGESSHIYAKTKGGLKAIFPEDTLGNYFYLRTDPSVSFIQKVGYEDCGAGKSILDYRAVLFIVCVIKDADEYTIIQNLINTCVGFKSMNIIPVSAIWLRENVVLAEMSGFDEEKILRTLTRLKSETIVRIQFQANKEYIPNTCINNPCKEC